MPYGGHVGIQYGYNTAHEGQLAFFDQCFSVVGPTTCIPFIGTCYSGKIVGHYESQRTWSWRWRTPGPARSSPR